MMVLGEHVRFYLAKVAPPWMAPLFRMRRPFDGLTVRRVFIYVFLAHTRRRCGLLGGSLASYL
jgi:hypothetical protein